MDVYFHMDFNPFVVFTMVNSEAAFDLVCEMLDDLVYEQDGDGAYAKKRHEHAEQGSFADALR